MWRLVLIPVLAAALYGLFAGHAFINYDTAYALLWGSELAGGAPARHRAAARPHAAPAGEPRRDGPHAGHGGRPELRLPRTRRLPRLPPRRGVVRHGGGRRRPRCCSSPASRSCRSACARTSTCRSSASSSARCSLEVKRPRAGWPVLALLALAGLLRPEAWLFSAAYVVWLRDWRLLAARRLRAGAVVPARPDPHRRPALQPARHAGERRGARAQDRPGRPRPVRPAAARRDPARAAAARARRRRRAGLARAPAAAARRARPGARRVRDPRHRGPADHHALPAAHRRAGVRPGRRRAVDGLAAPRVGAGERRCCSSSCSSFAPGQFDRLDRLERSIGIQERILDDLDALPDRGRRAAGRSR